MFKKYSVLSLLAILSLVGCSTQEAPSKPAKKPATNHVSSLVQVPKEQQSYDFGSSLTGSKATFVLKPISAEGTGINITWNKPVQMSLPLPSNVVDQPGTSNAEPPFLADAFNLYVGATDVYLDPENITTSKNWFSQQMTALGYALFSSGSNNTAQFLDFKKTHEPEVEITFEDNGTRTRVQLFGVFIDNARPNDSIIPKNIKEIQVGDTYLGGINRFNDKTDKTSGFIGKPKRITNKKEMDIYVNEANQMTLDTTLVKHCPAMVTNDKPKEKLVKFITDDNDVYLLQTQSCNGIVLTHNKQFYALVNNDAVFELFK